MIHAGQFLKYINLLFTCVESNLTLKIPDTVKTKSILNLMQLVNALNHKKTNIIIPAITINDELLKCLKEINKIYYSSFFVTIVLNHDSKIKLPKYRYKINKLVVGKINMSKKRNIAAKKFNSEYIAFLDSDAYPNRNWLRLGIGYLKQKKVKMFLWI